MEKATGAMGFVDACRSPIRRGIMLAAEEAQLSGNFITAKGLSEHLDVNMNSLSYHVRELAKAGALRSVGGEQIRGAWQKHYVPTEAFQASMTDTVALDQISELIDGMQGGPAGLSFKRVVEIIRATGRPVEA